MGLLDRFRKNSREDDEDEDDDEIDDEEEDEDDEEDDDEYDDDDEEEAEKGGGLFGMIRGLGGKLLGQGDDDDDDDEDEEEGDEGDEDDDESPAAPPSAPVQAAPEPAAETDAAEQSLTPSLEEFSFEEPVSPSPDSANAAENLPVNHEAVTGLIADDPGGDSPGAPDQADLTSVETPAEEDISSTVGMSLGNIFDKKVEIDQKLRSLAMSQEETSAEVLATDLHNFLRELEELIPS